MSCVCCGCKIKSRVAFEFGNWTDIPMKNAITDCVDNWAKINDADALIIGHDNCNFELDPATRNQFQLIVDWFKSGNKRVVVLGEYINDEARRCMTGQGQIDVDFILGQLGATMSTTNSLLTLDIGCDEKWTGTNLANFKFMFHKGKQLNLYHAAVPPINLSGASIVATTNDDPSIVYAAVEEVDKSYIFFATDSNVLTGCDYDNCQLFRNFIEMENPLDIHE